ncbi:hypothetical protein HDU76_002358 [Blyttiomyces sp. JEL0837]|nr:hypothetical protein HDU76_002358 [Blyttiomyces sp. JEL0837]
MRTVGIFFAMITLLGIIVSITGVFQKKEGDSKDSKTSQTTNSFPAATQPKIDDPSYDPYTGISIYASPSSVDPISKTFKLSLGFLPAGDMVGRALHYNVGLFTLKYPVTIAFQTKALSFPAGVIMQPQEISLNLVTGDPNSYPFESYRSDLIEITATYQNTTSGKLETAPIDIIVSGGLQTWNIDTPIVQDLYQDGSVLELQLQYSRSATTKFFSVLVMVIMWALSLLSFTLSTTLWLRDRKVEPPTVAVGVALLFALPAVRNSQPGIPAIGCTADVVSFFWAMVLAACSVSMLYANYIFKYKN